MKWATRCRRRPNQVLPERHRAGLTARRPSAEKGLPGARLWGFSVLTIHSTAPYFCTRSTEQHSSARGDGVCALERSVTKIALRHPVLVAMRSKGIVSKHVQRRPALMVACSKGVSSVSLRYRSLVKDCDARKDCQEYMFMVIRCRWLAMCSNGVPGTDNDY